MRKNTYTKCMQKNMVQNSSVCGKSQMIVEFYTFCTANHDKCLHILAALFIIQTFFFYKFFSGYHLSLNYSPYTLVNIIDYLAIFDQLLVLRFVSLIQNLGDDNRSCFCSFSPCPPNMNRCVLLHTIYKKL